MWHLTRCIHLPYIFLYFLHATSFKMYAECSHYIIFADFNTILVKKRSCLWYYQTNFDFKLVIWYIKHIISLYWLKQFTYIFKKNGHMKKYLKFLQISFFTYIYSVTILKGVTFATWKKIIWQTNVFHLIFNLLYIL